jgi:hypothetical protein
MALRWEDPLRRVLLAFSLVTQTWRGVLATFTGGQVRDQRIALAQLCPALTFEAGFQGRASASSLSCSDQQARFAGWRRLR